MFQRWCKWQGWCRWVQFSFSTIYISRRNRHNDHRLRILLYFSRIPIYMHISFNGPIGKAKVSSSSPPQHCLKSFTFHLQRASEGERQLSEERNRNSLFHKSRILFYFSSPFLDQSQSFRRPPPPKKKGVHLSLKAFICFAS